MSKNKKGTGSIGNGSSSKISAFANHHSSTLLFTNPQDGQPMGASMNNSGGIGGGASYLITPTSNPSLAMTATSPSPTGLSFANNNNTNHNNHSFETQLSIGINNNSCMSISSSTSSTSVNLSAIGSSTGGPIGNNNNNNMSPALGGGGGATSGGGSSATASSSNNPSGVTTSVTNAPVIQYYLIAYGQVKHRSDEACLHSVFMSRHDLDGKFIYLEPG